MVWVCCYTSIHKMAEFFKKLNSCNIGNYLVNRRFRACRDKAVPCLYHHLLILCADRGKCFTWLNSTVECLEERNPTFFMKNITYCWVSLYSTQPTQLLKCQYCSAEPLWSAFVSLWFLRALCGELLQTF